MNGRDSLRARRGRMLVVYVVLCLPFIVYGAAEALKTSSNSPLTWVPASFGPRAEYDQNVSRFGTGEVILASWPGCTLDQPRLDELLRSLRVDPLFRDTEGNPYFERITCGREIIHRLTHGPFPLSQGEAVSRFRGSLIGDDGRQTCIIIPFSEAGLRNRDQLIAEIQRCICEQFQITEEEVHLAGPVINGWTVDRAGSTSMNHLAPICAVMMLLLSCLCLRSLRDGVVVFGVSVLCQGATLAVVHFSGVRMNALLIVLPPLIQVLAIAGGIHLTNYYRDSLPMHGPSEAPWQAIRLGWLPCLLSSGTTALGIGSLMGSHLAPIRSFGVFGSFGILLIFGLLMMVVPAVWLAWPKRGSIDRAVSSAGQDNGFTATVTNWTSRYWPTVLAFAGLAMLGCGYFLKDLRTSVRIETLFRNDSRILRDSRWLEDHVGPLVGVDVVVSWPRDGGASVTDQLEQLSAIQRSVGAVADVRSSISALQLLPAPPSPVEIPWVQTESVLDRIMNDVRPQLTEAGFFAEDKRQQHWRISARISATAQTDYRETLHQLRAVISPQVQAGKFEVQCTGVMPLVQEVQSQLTHDLLHSSLIALGIITVVMTLAQAGFLAGLIAMIPNVFPIVLLFGVLGWRGDPVDIGTVMTASVALGIAVDDSLHFLTFFQQAVVEGRSRVDAVQFAYRHCAKAMIQTSVVCGVGLLVFGFADFLPTSRFAFRMSILILLALVADLVVLPSLLLSPLGGFFAHDNGRGSCEEPLPADCTSESTQQEAA